MAKRPNTDLVSVAWASLVLPADRVATKLPADDLALAPYFVRMMISGGTPNPDVPLRSPVVTAQCWAAPSSPGSQKIPWGRASEPADDLLAATYDFDLMDRRVDLGAEYGPARVLTVIPLAEPRRIEGMENYAARFDLDLLINWRAD